MKRMHSGRIPAGAAESGGEQGFWPSYADMMSALALILFSSCSSPISRT